MIEKWDFGVSKCTLTTFGSLTLDPYNTTTPLPLMGSVGFWGKYLALRMRADDLSVTFVFIRQIQGFAI